jgi:hypothetical protein
MENQELLFFTPYRSSRYRNPVRTDFREEPEMSGCMRGCCLWNLLRIGAGLLVRLVFGKRIERPPVPICNSLRPSHFGEATCRFQTRSS